MRKQQCELESALGSADIILPILPTAIRLRIMAIPHTVTDTHIRTTAMAMVLASMVATAAIIVAAMVIAGATVIAAGMVDTGRAAGMAADTVVAQQSAVVVAAESVAVAAGNTDSANVLISAGVGSASAFLSRNSDLCVLHGSE
jgi:hypothetical protein